MRAAIFGAVALTSVLAAVPAQAAPVIYFTNGNYSLTSYPFPTSLTVVDSFDQTGRTSGTPFVAAAGESVGSGSTVMLQSGSVPPIASDPTPAGVGGNNYLDIVNGTFTYTLSQPAQLFSFILGSLDSYNTLTLNFANGTSQGYNGAAIIGGSPSIFNGTGNSSVAGRVTFDAVGGSSITSATFGTTSAAFEIDEIATAVPEPATWGFMILGLGLVGGQLRSRRKVQFATA